MLQDLLPSRLLSRLVPAFARVRYGSVIDKQLANADAIVAGIDENALSLRTALITFSIRALSALIAYFSQVLIARWIGSYEYGIFVWVWVLSILLGGLSSMGFPSAVTRFIPEYQVSNQTDGVRGVVFGSRVLSVAMATFIAATGITVAYLFEEWVTTVYLMPLFVAAICLPMLALAEVQDGISRAFNWVLLSMMPTYILRPLAILLVMAVALALGFEASAMTALISAIIATWSVSVFQLLCINSNMKKTVPEGPKTTSVRTWLAVSIPIFLVDGFFNLLTSVDILIAGAYLPPEQVAVYFAAVKTLAVVHFVYFAVKASSAHRFSRYYRSGEMDTFRAYAHDTVRWTFWPSVLVAIALLLVGELLLSLFGEDFADGYPLLLILILGIIARASVGPTESLLNMVGEQKYCAVAYALALLVNIVLNVTMIPKFGLYGAAWATTIAMFFESFALYALTLRRLNIHMFVFAKRPEPVQPIVEES